jgi:RimJ/RimL family protein N-acetyltransferase
MDTAYRDQGYAAEACPPIIDFAKNDLRLARLVSHIAEGNVPAINMGRHLGFRLEQNHHPDYGGWVAICDNKVFGV